jgi:hypothetical protein
MLHSGPGTSLFLIVLVPLIAWRLYARVRRSVGRQRLGKVRPWVTVVLFPALVALLCVATLRSPIALGALALGALVGAVLGGVGLKLTRFEATNEGFFYVPNLHLGIALSLLMAGRIIYRMVALEGAVHSVSSPPDAFLRSPLTLIIFGTLAGYYTAYAAGLISWRLRGRAPFEASRRSASIPAPTSGS